MIGWFGPVPFAEACRETPKMDTPVGMACGHCGELFVPGDMGYVPSGVTEGLHVECFTRMIMGSVGHQLHTCSCYGGEEEDPPHLNTRNAALAAFLCARGIRDGDCTCRTSSCGHVGSLHLAGRCIVCVRECWR